MKRLIIPALMASVFAAEAAHLSPQEALDAYLSRQPLEARAPGTMQAADYTLALRGENDALYAFNVSHGGFLLLGADDGVMLGYGTAPLDPDNMAPALAEVLYAYALSPMSVRNSLPAHADIPVMCGTRWDQDAPYNDLCPIDKGQHTYTGCMATAIAQVLAHKSNRMQGTGTHSYRWETGDTKLTFDYGATTFDYASMLDVYNSDSQQKAKDAVATLMYGVGVAVEMDYSTMGSGTYDAVSGAGLINNLGCDRAMTVLNRDFYTPEEWDKLIYDQLATGRPMVYTGVSSGGGHAFVCDGYERRGDANYYHFNWGWSGNGDGFFMIDLLNPNYSGIGGGDMASGYNMLQSAFLGIKPAETGSKAPVMFWQFGALTARESSYTRTDMVELAFTGSDFYGGGAILYGGLEAEKIAYGLKYTNLADNSVEYMRLGSDYFTAGSGFQELMMKGNRLPESDGTYLISLAFYYDDEWIDPLEELVCKGELTVRISGDNASFSLADKGRRLRAALRDFPGWIVIDGTNHLDVEFTAGDGAVDTEVKPAVVTSGGRVMASQSLKQLKLDDGQSTVLTWDEPFAPTLRRGSYFLTFVNDKGEQVGTTRVPVKAVPTGSVVVVGSDGGDAVTEYFTIDGRRIIGTPEPGSPVIRRQGNKVEKIVLKE